MTWSGRAMIALTLLCGCAVSCRRGRAVRRRAGLAPSQETSSVWASAVTADRFEAAQVEFDVSAGLRTGIAFRPDAGWDFRVAWTYVPTSAGASIAPGGQLAIPEFFSGFLSGDAYAFTAASVDWRLNYHVLDFEPGTTSR
ncbi:MAG: hypothetical protein QM811_23990 [Pirellulales bacterium]